VRAASPTAKPFAAASLLLIRSPWPVKKKTQSQSFVRAFGLFAAVVPRLATVASLQVDQGLP